MAQSRPTTTTDGAKALAHEFTSLKRRVRDLELRPDPSGSGSGPVDIFASFADLSGRVHNITKAMVDANFGDFGIDSTLMSTRGFHCSTQVATSTRRPRRAGTT
jgi:hypothetical protein